VRIAVNYLFERNGRLYFRRKVPDHLKDTLGKTEWKTSLKLKAGQEVEAAQLVRQLTRETDRSIREAERQAGSGIAKVDAIDRAFIWAKNNALLAGDEGRRSEFDGTSEVDFEIDSILSRTVRRARKNAEDELKPEDFTLDDWARLQVLRRGEKVELPCTMLMAAEHYRRYHKQGKALPKAEQYAVEQYVEWAGDKVIAEIRRRDVVAWIAYQRDVREQSGTTIRRRLNSLSAIVQRAIDDLEIETTNPFARHRVADASTPARDQRQPFHRSHLDLIDDYVSSRRGKAETRLILTLMKETTCGPAEIGGLDWADVKLDAEVPHIKIRENAHRSLKTGATRERDFPLAGDALGALKALAGDEPPTAGLVFSESALNNHSLSARLNKAIRAAGVPTSTRLTAYSFRHTFEEAMRVAGVSERIQRYLMGHSDRTITDSYGASRPDWASLKAAVEATLPKLGEVDPDNYRPEELIQVGDEAGEKCQ